MSTPQKRGCDNAIKATLWACVFFALPGAHPIQARGEQMDSSGGQKIILDRVVAIVNRQAILASDVETEMQISVLDPSRNLKVKETPQQALDRLISRTLIQQEVRQEELSASLPTAAEVATRVRDIRKELPACVRLNCETDAGWNKFLAQHDLTPAGVEDYIRNRVEILRFIELRFRQGIRISPDEIDKYYRETLLPQYPAGVTPPSVQQVSSRIEEVLLQQRVTELFSSWLSNLRKQGQIEILDTTMAPAADSEEGEATKE